MRALLRPVLSASVRGCPHFSVEMETGTGKTYVYHRAARERIAEGEERRFDLVRVEVHLRVREDACEHLNAV